MEIDKELFFTALYVGPFGPEARLQLSGIVLLDKATMERRWMKLEPVCILLLRNLSYNMHQNKMVTNFRVFLFCF